MHEHGASDLTPQEFAANNLLGTAQLTADSNLERA
jgi:hypothetical protein